VKETVGGVCLIQNGLDIVPALCGHYLGLGFDRLLFLDDKSTDGTYEFLLSLSWREPRVRVERIDMKREEDQEACVTDGANRLIAEGFTTVFPFDADEFWNIDLRAVRATSRAHASCVFEGQFVQFVQDRRAKRSQPLNLLRAKHRAPVLEDSSLKSVRLCGSYVCFAKTKMGVKSSSPVAFSRGNHAVQRVSPDVCSKGLEVFHLILRSLEEVEVRAERSVFFIDYWRRADTPKRQRKVWAANSANRAGCLNTPDGPVMLIPDVRLRTMLLKAMIYMVLRHPILTLTATLICQKPRPARRWPGAHPSFRAAASQALYSGVSSRASAYSPASPASP